MDNLPNNERQTEFVQLLSASHRRLLAYLVSLLGNMQDAEDVLQRSSITMWQKFEAFESGTNFFAWASTFAFYEARNFQRTNSRSRLVFSDELVRILSEDRVQDLAHVDPRHEALSACLEELDQASRKLLEAAYLDSKSIASLADQLGRAPQTLYNKLNLLRRLLSTCVGQRLNGRFAHHE